MKLLLTALLILGLQTVPATPTLDALVKELTALRAAVVAPPQPTVATSADLQAALDAAPAGGTVYLKAGVTYTANVIFRQRGSVTLTTAGFAVPPGTRVAPSDAATMAKLVCADCFQPTIGFEFGAHDVTVVGVEVIGNPVHPDRATINVGNNPITWAAATTIAQQPSNITFDRVYEHAEATGGRQGVLVDGVNVKVVNSYIAGFWLVGADSQAIGMIQGAGPLLVQNNYLEASGENLLVGGADPLIAGLIPADLTVTGNTFFKPLAWKTAHPGSVKNLFELKNAQRVIVTRNVFENVWTDAQPGSAILFTVRNQDGACPWCTIKDVAFTCNEIRNVSNFAFNILATDNIHPSGMAERITIAHNLVTGATSGAQIIAGGVAVALTDNVMPGLTRNFLALSGAPGSGFVFTGNQVAAGSYGISGDNTAVGAPSLTAFQPGATFTGNTIELSAERLISYPPGNAIVATGAVVASNWTGCPVQ